MGEPLRFLLGHEPREVTTVDPTLTVLEYLRRTESRCGTKEGCAEGDCGACTVVLGEPAGNDMMVYRAVNSCIQFMPTLQGKQLITVEDLKQPDGQLHPVQQTFCDHHASQCGFCTPGFVMSLFANWRNKCSENREQLKDTIAGNLCRCTGYGPILEAAEAVSGRSAMDHFDAEEAGTARVLSSLEAPDVVEGGGKRCFLPRTGNELAALYQEHPGAHIIAGLTDVGLWVTKQHRELDTLILLSGIPDLSAIEETEDGVRFGAAVTLADAHPVLARHFPAMDELMRRFAARQIRNAGTLCGNIANGSPIGDGPPALIALDATLHLRRGDERRALPLEDFFITYGQQDRRPGEFVEAVSVPYLRDGDQFACHKLSKRIDQDISAVMMAFRVCTENDTVTDARICYGGMAGTPKRASRAEQTLLGQPWGEAAVRDAMAAMEADFEPLTDMRATDQYRMRAAQNLFYREFLNLQNEVGAHV
ncbi:MAG: xanthine dehydrogenase small subunit [Pseudomonadota bacterium]